MRIIIRISMTIVLVLALFSSCLISGPKKAFALADVDQGCSYATDPIAYTFLSHEPGQIFIPTKNTLDAVQVYVKAGIGASANIKMEVISQHHGSITTKTQAVTDQWSWVLFDVPDVTMPLDTYGIKLRNADAQSNSVWMQGPSSCYEQGWAIYEGHAQEYKYRFAINAYNTENPAQPAETPVDQGVDTGDSSGLGVSSGSSSAPSANTSSSVSAPLNLTAINESSYLGTGIGLKWVSPATSDIGGYKIFRSTFQDSGFTEIARTIGGIMIYFDSTVTVGNTYYYFVRAFNGNAESASSNIANATAKDTFKEEILKDHEANSGGGVFGGLAFALARFLIPAIIFGLIFILVIIGIILLIRRRRQNNQTQSQPENQPENQKTSKK